MYGCGFGPRGRPTARSRKQPVSVLESVRHRGPAGLAAWGSIGALAVAVGVAVGAEPKLGLALALAVTVGAVMVVRPASTLWILILSVFLEVVTVGGVAVSRIVAPLALLSVLVELLRGRAWVPAGPQLFWATAYSTVALASGLWTVSTSHTLTLLASLAIALTYMLCFASLVDSERELRIVLHVLAFASLLIGVVSLASFAGVSLVPAGSLQGGRAQGGVGDPNFFANVQLVAFPVILMLAADAKALWLRATLAFAGLVALASILSTLSRGGLIALMFVLVILLLIPARSLFPSRIYKTLVIVMLVAGLLTLSTRPYFRGEVVKRATSIFSNEAESTGSSAGSGREELWKAARHSISERPLLGVGFGAFPSVSNDLLFRTPGVDLTRVSAHPQGLEAHSAYIGTTADLGFVGLAAFLALVGSTTLALRRSAVRASRAGASYLSRVGNALVLSMVGWAISSFFIETETARPLWIVVGLSLGLPKLIDRHLSSAGTGV